ncbi:hypothetical protein MMC26_004752 [Xylographa opegraphella]|nr:hypothetical protein [Xylographa opegraphella]
MGKLSGFLGKKLTQLKAGSEAVVAGLNNIMFSKNNKYSAYDADLPHKLRHQNHPVCPSASDLSSGDYPFDPSAFQLEANEEGVLVLKRTSGYSAEYHKQGQEQLASANPLGIVSLGEGDQPEIAELEGDTLPERKEKQWYTSLQGGPFLARPNLVDNFSQPSTSSPPHSKESLVLDPDINTWPPSMQGPGSPYLQVPLPSSTSVARLRPIVPTKDQAARVIKRKPVPKPSLPERYSRNKPLPELPSDQRRHSHKPSFRKRIENFVGRPMPSLESSADRISFHAAAGKDILCIFAEIDPVAPGFTNKVVAKVLRGRSKESGDSRRTNSFERAADLADPVERLRELRETVKLDRMFVQISEPLLHMGEPFKISF